MSGRPESAWSRAREKLSPDSGSSTVDADERLRERAARIAAPVSSSRDLSISDEMRLRIGGAIVVLPTPALAGVHPLTTPTPLPGAPPHLLGLVRVRGALSAVFDLGPLLTGRDSERGAEAKLVRVTAPGHPDLVLLVEGFDEEHASSLDAVSPPDGSAPLIRGMGPGGELLLDTAALLADHRFFVDHKDDV